MQTRSKYFDDIAKISGGASSTLSGLKLEVENLVRQQIEKILIDTDMVSREEFKVVKAMAVKARNQQDVLEERIQKLEQNIKKKSSRKTKLDNKALPKNKKPKPKHKPKPKMYIWGRPAGLGLELRAMLACLYRKR